MFTCPFMPLGRAMVSFNGLKSFHDLEFTITDFSVRLPGVRRRTAVVAAKLWGKSNCTSISLRARCEEIVKANGPKRVDARETEIRFPSCSHVRGMAFPSQRVSDCGSSKTSSHFVISATTSWAGVEYGAAPS